jgi:ABC-type Fe3+ transport system permease subunit
VRRSVKNIKDAVAKRRWGRNAARMILWCVVFGIVVLPLLFLSVQSLQTKMFKSGLQVEH